VIFTRSKKQGMHGFTLVELLLAIVIFAVVVSLTYGAYNTTFKVIHNASTNSKYSERARITLERMTDDLLSFYMGKSTIFTGESQFFGEYRGDSLQFTSTAHLLFHKNQQPHGQTTITYTVEENDGILKLYRADVPNIPGVEEDEEKGLLLCDGLKEVAISYLDSDGGETDSWSESDGSGGNALPAIVRVKIGFVDEEDPEQIIYYATAVALANAQ